MTLFFCPSVGQEAINDEDKNFIQYLKVNGYDLSNLGDGTIVHEYEESGESFNDPKDKMEPRVRQGSASDTSSTEEKKI